MAIIDTLIMTKTAGKPYPLGPHIPLYSPYKGVPTGSPFIKDLSELTEVIFHSIKDLKASITEITIVMRESIAR